MTKNDLITYLVDYFVTRGEVEVSDIVEKYFAGAQFYKIYKKIIIAEDVFDCTHYCFNVKSNIGDDWIIQFSRTLYDTDIVGVKVIIHKNSLEEIKELFEKGSMDIGEFLWYD